MAETPRPARAPIFLGVAALLASWNVAAAPFGLLAGLAAVALGTRALLRPGPRRLPLCGLALGAAAALSSAAVVGHFALAGRRDGPGAAVIDVRTASELDGSLGQAGQRTLVERERARKQLEALGEKAYDQGGAGAKAAEAGSQAVPHRDHR